MTNIWEETTQELDESAIREVLREMIRLYKNNDIDEETLKIIAASALANELIENLNHKFEAKENKIAKKLVSRFEFAR